MLPSRLSPPDVRAFVEQLFADSFCSFAERLSYLDRPRRWHFRADFETVYGHTTPNRIKCGDNPFLYARLVENLRVEIDPDGFERLLWDELPYDTANY